MRNNIRIMLVISVIFLSCKQNTAKKINYSGLKVFSCEKFNDTSNKRLTVLHYVNVSCSSCLTEIDDLKKIINLRLETVDFKLVCHSKNDFEYFKHLFNTKKINLNNYCIYFDEDNLFEYNNSDFKNGNNKIAVTNESGKVLFLGNPIKNFNEVNRFMSTIN